MSELRKYAQKHTLFTCECPNPAHHFVVTCTPGEIDVHPSGRDWSAPPDLFVTIAPAPYLPWYRRLLVAFRYALGLPERDTAYDVTLLSPVDAAELSEILAEFVKEYEAWTEEHTRAIESALIGAFDAP